MFVGEEAPVATVASSRPEDPVDAPAMMTVVSREEIDRNGYQTLAELLARQPGFFMMARGRGTTPFLRGLSDSVLFLYDGVPITTDVTKGLGVLDREISLAAVERIEITRGPGSILWGPDAFAGVVNIVPFRGGRRPGAVVNVRAGGNDLLNADLTLGLSPRQWQAFLAFSGSREEYQSPDYTVRTVAGDTASGRIDHSKYQELTTTLDYGDWLHVTGRWSDFNRRYTMNDSTGGQSWPGEKKAPVNLLKAEISKVMGPSHYTLMGFLQEINYQIEDADLAREQQSRMEHLELRWDRRLFSRGLFTAGGSWRRNMVRDAVVRDGFLPDYLAPEIPIFVPVVQQADFDNELISFFAQARYKWGKAEYWAGGRLDNHNRYGTTQSYSFGFNWPLAETIHLKASYGNAFRSPYSSQLYGDLQFEPESILTAAAQLSWMPKPDYLLELTLFRSNLHEHSTEDPYGGLSLPAGQQVEGLELAAVFPLNRAVKLNFGLTLLSDHDNEERFRKFSYSFIRPNGTQVSVYDEWTEPFDQGPRWLAAIGLDWRIGEGHDLMVNSRFGGPIEYSYAKGAVTGRYSQPVLVDLTYNRPGFRPGHDSVSLAVTNLLDRDYQVPDTFGPTSGPPLRISLSWQYRF